MNHKLFVPPKWQHLFAIGAVAICAGNTAHAESAATLEQQFPTGYLESVATGYENGQATQTPTTDKTRTTTPGTVTPTSSVAQPATPVSSPKEKEKKTTK